MDGLVYASYAKSAAQENYTRQRMAALAEQRRLKKEKAAQDANSEHIERSSTSFSSTITSATSRTSTMNGIWISPMGTIGPLFPESRAEFALRRTLSAESAVNEEEDQQPAGPFELRHGRRYLREVPYPIPCDLAEIQRENMRTELACKIFGRPTCSPRIQKNIPRKVLEIGCGSGYWSARCHDYFSQLGYKDVSFTGLDIAPLAPDLKKQGVNWTFVQHDLRKPLPFSANEFDLVMLKDVGLVLPSAQICQKLHNEAIRVLRKEGVLEIWESDLILKSLLPHLPPPVTRQTPEQDTANDTGTFIINSGTPFAPAQNRCLQQANRWVQTALDRRGLSPTPAATIKQTLSQSSIVEIGMRRIAVPLGKLLWERDPAPPPRDSGEFIDSPLSSKGKMRMPDRALNANQLALRHVALLTFVQMIESMEPMLKEANGKNAEEWSHWWAAFMAEVLDPTKGVATGECLEMAAWWATKRADD